MEYYNYGSDYSTYNSVSDMSNGLGTIVALGGMFWIATMALCVLLIVSMWKIFVKAGKPGWAALVPYYNFYVMCEIAGKPWWYIFLFFIPFANIYALFVIFNGIAKKLGKSTGFTIGMILLPFIFFPILAFGKTEVVQNDDSAQKDMTNNNQIETLDNANMQNDFATVAPTFDNMSVPTDEVVNNVFESAPVINEPVAQVNDFTAVTPTFDDMSEQIESVVNNAFESSPVINEPVAQVNDFAAVTPTFDDMSVPTDEVVNNAFESAPVINEPVAQVNDFAAVTPTFDNMNVPTEPVAPVFNASSEVESVASDISNANQNTSLWSNQNNNTNNGEM